MCNKRQIFAIKSQNNLYFSRVSGVIQWKDFVQADIFTDRSTAHKQIMSIPKKDRQILHPETVALDLSLTSDIPQTETETENDTVIQIKDEYIQEDIPELTEDNRSFSEILNNTPCDNELLSILNILDDITTKYTSLKNQTKTYISSADKSMSDIYHYIEFNKFDAADGYKLARKLKDVTEQRRKYKNTALIINIIKNMLSIDENDILKLKTQCATLNARRYTERVLDVEQELHMTTEEQ